MIKRLLVANRGEIARRIIRTARRLGVETVAVYSEADAQMLHVKEADQAVAIGGARPQESYLSIERILDAARKAGADAIHPGYGFLSERAPLAQACQEAGILFVGPTAEVIAKMGDKQNARELAKGLGIPTPPGSPILQTAAEAKEAAAAIGYPVLLKAAAGGGGIGMKKVDKEDLIEKSFEEVSNRAQSAFGDGRVYLEKYLPSPHHIEIQVFGDAQGKVVTFPERECSVQRRHQKVIEESPSPFATGALRADLRSAARRLAQALGYRNAGTVEFVVDAERRFYLLEVNTRLQVEHPVTEAITGLDLVEWQLRVASGEPLPLEEEKIAFAGHALEARIYAEDPVRFFPSPGKITVYEEPKGEGTRVDSGFQAGDTITPFYDPLIAKLIVKGAAREEAIKRMQEALSAYRIEGPKTNLPFLQRAFGSELFRLGVYDTHFIENLNKEATTHG